MLPILLQPTLQVGELRIIEFSQPGTVVEFLFKVQDKIFC
jgi:hypothetical protein